MFPPEAHGQVPKTRELRPADPSIRLTPIGADRAVHLASLALPPVHDHPNIRKPGESPGQMFVERSFSGTDDEEQSDPGEGWRGQFFEQLRGVPRADAVSLDRVVDRLALAEQRLAPLLLAPRANDFHLKK